MAAPEDARARVTRDIEMTARRLQSNASRVRLWGDTESDAEWPACEPVPEEVFAAVNAAAAAVDAVETAITKARLAYRRRVLEWLLAESEHDLRAKKENL